MNAMGAQFCSDCGLAPQGGRVAALPAPTTAPRGRFVELVPFAIFGVIALGLLALNLIR